MKNYNSLLFILVICATTSTGYTQSLEEFRIGAGATFSKSEGLDMGIGYYVSLNTTGKINNVIGYSGLLQFSNYHAKIEDIAINYYSIDPTFFFHIYPGQEKFSLLAGISSTFFIDAKVDGEDAEINQYGGMYFATGAAFNVNDKLGILARYNIPFSDDGFDYTASVGVTYKF